MAASSVFPHGEASSASLPSMGEFSERLKEGIAQRRQLAAVLFGGGPYAPVEQRHPSVFGALMAQRSAPGLAPAPYLGDDRWAYVAAILAAPSLDAQRPLVRSIVPPQDEAFVTLFTIGALMSSAALEPEALALLGPADLSIIVESLAAAGRLPDVLTGLGGIANFAPGSTEGLEVLSLPWLQIREHLPSRANGGLAAFQRAVQDTKHQHVPLFGPDVFSMLQALSEPSMSLTEDELERMLALAARWHLDDLVIQFLSLRTLGDYPGEQAFLRRRFSDVIRALSSRQSASLEALLFPETSAVPTSGRPIRYFEAVTQLFLAVRKALERRDPSSLVGSVIDLYALDPALVGFLPWNRISFSVADLMGRDARTAFMTYLMSEDQVRAQYPRVALRFGKGALIADLMSLVEINVRRDAVNHLLGRVAALPDRAARALTRAILERPIIERLASSLPSPRAIRTIRGNEHHRISLMTIDALRLAHQRGLVPEAELRRRFGREMDSLRFDFLQGQFRSGRVRVAWHDLKREVAELFADDLPISAMQITSANAPSGVAPRLAAYSAQRITGHLLEGSENGINQALSSNLRHGVVLPRYLKAFDDALQAVWPKAPMLTWDETPARNRFGDYGPEVLALRERLSDLVKGFMDRRLTVEAGGAFAADLQERIRIRLTEYFDRGGSPRSAVLPRSLISIAQHELRRHLRAAVRGLNEDVRKTINLELKAMRRRIPPRSGHEFRSYIDSLETCLHAAYEQVREWMALVSRSGAARPFTFPDIVQLHLMSAALDAREKLRVQSTVTVNGGESPTVEIRGELLVFFEEVVRNLLSNAFKGSGDALKTRADLKLAISANGMTIRCSNVINTAKVSEVVGDYKSTLAKAQRPITGQAQKDKQSGFQKIRLAYKQAQMPQPAINIPPISRRNPRFVISLDAALPPGGILADRRRP